MAGGLKRAVDLVLSAVLLVLVLPVLLTVLLLSAISLRAWPVFAQDRVGRNGVVFRFYKVRTLPPTAPQYTDKHNLDFSEVPPVCRMIRRFHLDELPQLLHVVVGRMSLVGPRPEMPHLHQRMEPAFSEARTSVRPGCTGLWQVSPSCTELIDVSPQYDRFYISNSTVRFDLWILYRTALKMTGLRRSADFDQIPAWVIGSAAADGLSPESLSPPVSAIR